MKIQVNTDTHIEGRAALVSRVSGMVQDSLSRVCTHVTRVEVHLKDENAAKSGKLDKRCTMEARLNRYPPLAVSESANNMGQAVQGAASKLLRAIENTLERLHDPRGHAPGAGTADKSPDV